MQTNIKYSEVYKQLLALILIPIVYIQLLGLAVFLVDKYCHTEMSMMICIIGGILLFFAICIFTAMKVVVADAEMKYDERGICFQLSKKTFLFQEDNFFINYQNIENASINRDTMGRSFATLKTKLPEKSIIISPDKKENTANFINFWNNLETHFSSFNASNTDHPALIIKNKGFYQSGFIKFIAYFSAVIAILLTIVKIAMPDSISIWRLLLFYCYALPFVYTVHSNKKPGSYNEK